MVLRLSTLLPPRAGWPAGWRVRSLLPELPVGGSIRCWRMEPLLMLPLLEPLLLPVLAEGALWRVAELPLLLRVLLPLRLAWLPLRAGWLLPVDGALCRMLLWLLEELRLTEPRPFVLPDWLELRVWEDGADIEEEGRPPPLLRALPPPDPPRELLPPLVWAPRGTAIIAAAATAIRESVVKRFMVVCF